MQDRITKEQRSYNMSRIKGKDTNIEVKVRKYLYHNGYRYKKNVKDLPGKPDIVLEKYKTVKKMIKENAWFVCKVLLWYFFYQLSCTFGFSLLDDAARLISGKDIYLKLKEKGVLVRHFEKDRIRDFNRITIGTQSQMETFINTLKEVLL